MTRVLILYGCGGRLTVVKKILTYALIALVALVVLKIALGLLGVLIGLAVSVLVLAAMGYVLYALLRIFSPATAAKIRAIIAGKPSPTP